MDKDTRQREMAGIARPNNLPGDGAPKVARWTIMVKPLRFATTCLRSERRRLPIGRALPV